MPIKITTTTKEGSSLCDLRPKILLEINTKLDYYMHAVLKYFSIK